MYFKVKLKNMFSQNNSGGDAPIYFRGTLIQGNA